MMKKAILAILLVFTMIKPIQAATAPAPIHPDNPIQKMTMWFKSLPMPTPEDFQVVKDFVNAKWQCLRHGIGCSRAERAKLAALSAAVTAAAAAAVIVPTRRYFKKKEEERMKKAAEAEEQRKRDEAEEQKKREEEIREELKKRSEELEESIIAQKGIPAAIREAMRVKDGFIKEMEREGRLDDMAQFYKVGISLFEKGTDISALIDHFKNPLGKLGSFGVIALSPHIPDEEKIKSFAYLSNNLGFQPNPADLLQLQLFDWERKRDPVRKMEKFQEQEEKLEYYGQRLPQQLFPAIERFVVPQPVLPIPERLKPAMNERAELREVITRLNLFISQKPSDEEKAQWFDNNIIVHDPIREVITQDKVELLHIIANAFRNSPELAKFPEIFQQGVAKSYPNVVRFELIGPTRNYTIKDIIWGSPATTEEQKNAMAFLQLSDKLKRAELKSNLWDLHRWENPVGGFKLPQ